MRMKWWQLTHQGESPRTIEPAGRSTARTWPPFVQLRHAHFGRFLTTASIGRSQSPHIAGGTGSCSKYVSSGSWSLFGTGAPAAPSGSRSPQAL